MKLRLGGNKLEANAVCMHTVRHHKHLVLRATACIIISQKKTGL